MVTNPLLRRLQVLPPETYEDNSYGAMIKRKRKKYLTSGQAFSVEGMAGKSLTGIQIAVILILVVTGILFGGPIIFAFLTKKK